MLEGTCGHLGNPAMSAINRRAQARWVTGVVASDDALSANSKGDRIGEVTAFGR
jgi:hypothetical protein